MSETPARVWLDYEHSNLHWMAFEEPPNGTDDSAKDEYVRADLADAWAKDRDHLRAELAEAQRERDALRVAIFGSDNYSTELTNGSFVQMALDTEAGRKGGVSRAVAAERDRDAAKAEAERLRKAALHAKDSMTGGMKVLAAHGLEDGYAWAALMLAIKNIDAALQEKPHE